MDLAGLHSKATICESNKAECDSSFLLHLPNSRNSHRVLQKFSLYPLIEWNRFKPPLIIIIYLFLCHTLCIKILPF